jgi:Uncharacterized protein conserved in archaea, COG1909
LQSDKPSLTLPEELRERLKEPFGRLIPDDQVDSFLQQLKQEGQVIVTVGDRTTRRCEEAGLEPILEIIDNKEKREKASYTFFPRRTTVINNPAATITLEAIREIESALKASSRSRLIVSGEEDLLVLPSIIFAKDGTIVLYGQPGQGLVAVTVNDESRAQAKNILLKMGWNPGIQR